MSTSENFKKFFRLSNIAFKSNFVLIMSPREAGKIWAIREALKRGCKKVIDVRNFRKIEFWEIKIHRIKCSRIKIKRRGVLRCHS